MKDVKIAFVSIVIAFSATIAAGEPCFYFGAPLARHEVSARKFVGIPSLCVTPKGRLWATWYAGITPGEDRNNYVILATSDDSGATWREVCVVDPDGDGPRRTFDSNVWTTPDGRLQWNWSERPQMLSGKEKKGWRAGSEDDRVYVAYGDDAESASPNWTTPQVVAPGVAMGKSMTLATGEWVMPVARWFDTQSSRMYVSTDAGASWSLRGGVTYPFGARVYDEHMFIEDSDGAIQCFSRTILGIGRSRSTDRGRTWTPGALAWLTQPNARFFVKRLKSGRLLLVKHGIAELWFNPPHCGREKLMAFLSDDDGETWKGGLMIDERKDVSYPDGDQSPDGTIWIIYDHERTRAREILMAVFTEEDVLARQFKTRSARSRVTVSSPQSAP